VLAGQPDRGNQLKTAGFVKRYIKRDREFP
jgi:hypothetical protein